MDFGHVAERVRNSLEWVVLVPVVCGSAYYLLTVLTALVLRLRARRLPDPPKADSPPVTVLKPVHGLEKNQTENLRSTCLQDYPGFQVVFSVQRQDDPALRLLREIQGEFGEPRVTIAVENCKPGSNGKINNMAGGLKHALHEVLVISDSDIRLRPDYLRTIVAPLSEPSVGCVCTLYRATNASRWFEKLELLTLNADYMASVIFAYVTGASKFCLGASTALTRTTLDRIGGLDSLADYLVEDFEMGRRIWDSGKEVRILPYLVDTMVDLQRPAQWWGHQVYWDQNTRAARPWAFFSTLVIRSVPFALVFAALRLFDLASLAVLLSAVAIRILTSAGVLSWGLGDREGLKCLYLLPFRDIAGLVSWVLALTRRTTVWRGSQFVLTRDGRLLPAEAKR